MDSITVKYDDVEYKLELHQNTYNLNLNNKVDYKLNQERKDYKLNFIGNMVQFKGDKTPPEALFLDDVTVTFTTGQTTILIDLSAYAKKGVVYYPIFVGQSFVASHLLDRCIYNVNTRELTLYNDSDVTTQSATDNTLVLIPMDSDVLSVVGITNGQYNGDYSRYYSKGEVNTLLEGKQNTLTFDDTPTQNSNNPVKSGGIYTALSNKADDSDVVKLTGNQTISGTKTFSGTTYARNFNLTKENSDKEGGQIGFDSADNEANAGKTMYIDRYDGIFRFVGVDSSNTTRVPLQVDIQNNTVIGVTPATSDNSTKIATTAYVNNKIVEVNALPASPDPDTWYAIPEV